MSALSTTRPEIGSLVAGKYQVLRLLGAGGMGEVFEARNMLTGKRVALKWMHPEVAENPSAAQRFMREAQACARVHHPNVVDVYDVLVGEGALYLVMELLEGESLTALMQRENTSLPALIGFVVAAMRGVAAAHLAGVIHRDIKPDNIFLAREGGDRHIVPKVLDFGISKVTNTEEKSITMEGAAIGTPLYMSVEQLRGVKDIDVRADVYAFGVILYQAVTGQPPFDADSFPVLIAKIMTEQALSPKIVRPDVPTSLSRLIEWAMARDRQERVPTIEALIAELEPYATEVGFRKQMTVGSSDIPSISTPSSRPRSDRAAAVAKTEPQPIAIEERSSARSDRSSAIGATSIPKSQRPWGLYALGLLCVLALTFWLWPTDEPAAQPDPHIVRPAIEPVASKAPAQPAIVTPPAAPLITPAKAPQPSAAPTATLPTSSAPPTSSRRTSPRASVAKEAPSIAKVSAPVPLVAVKEKPAPPEVKAQPAPAPTPKAASRLRAGEPSADDF